MNLKAVTIAFVAGALFTISTQSFAATSLKKINAILRPDYSIKVDGKKFDLENDPLAYGGTTYVPLKEAGKIFGYKVGFNSGTISLDKIKGDVDQVTTGTEAQPGSIDVNSNDWIALSKLKDDYGIEALITDGSKLGDAKVTLEKNGKTEVFEFQGVNVGDKLYTNENGNQILIKVRGGIQFNKEFIERFVAQ